MFSASRFPEGSMMTLPEGLAFWIFIVMTVSFFVWVAYLAIKR
jgi:hypothetical protein